MGRDTSYLALAKRNNVLHDQLVKVAVKDIHFIGFVCFFREQSIEMLLRQLLEYKNAQPSTMANVVELAKQIQVLYVDAPFKDVIARCVSSLGVALISWDINGRYSPEFMPQIDVLDDATDLYNSLLEVVASPVWDDVDAGTQDIYTSKFAGWAEKRG
ncbi:MAG: hypothetical protein RSC43_01075 [Clostridia bacterium]